MSTEPAPLRADARRSIELILDAARDELAHGQASMAAVAARAGVARATLYAHFPTREALIDAVTERSIAESVEVIKAAKPDEGDPEEALVRVLEAAWAKLGNYHGLVALTTSRPKAHQHKVHQPVVKLVRPLLQRGQRTGAFNPHVPVEWLMTVTLELIHAASNEVREGRLKHDEAEAALITTVLGALRTTDYGLRTTNP